MTRKATTEKDTIRKAAVVGFNVNGIHRYTGTPYSIDGFDREGYDNLGTTKTDMTEGYIKTDMTEKDTIRKA